MPEPVCRYARRVAAQLRGERRPRRAAASRAARFGITPAALDRVKIKASLALLKTTHDRVNSEALGPSRRRCRAAHPRGRPGDEAAALGGALAGRRAAALRGVGRVLRAAPQLGELHEVYRAVLSQVPARADVCRTEEHDALTVDGRHSSQPLDEAVAVERKSRILHGRRGRGPEARGVPRRRFWACCTAGRQRDFGLAPYRPSQPGYSARGCLSLLSRANA